MGEKDRGFGAWFGTTFLIGFGFFSMGLMDPLYDTYMPIFLGKYVRSMTLVGGIMTIDNVFALFLIPIVSFWSDRTRTSWGRRMPWIAVTLPLTALCFAYLPYAAQISFGALFATIVVLNVWKQSARGPVIALMPDIVPGIWRSEANGIINMMGGIASIVGTIGLARLMNLDATLPILGPTLHRIPFPIAGLLVFVATILLLIFVRENKPGATPEKAEERVRLRVALREIRGQGDRSVLWIFASLIAWFLAYQGVLPFIGRYSIDVLGATMGGAALPAGMVGIYTGLYYIASQSAAIAAPWITGAIIDIAGFSGIFGFATLGMAAAFIFMSFVKKGEAA